MKINFKVIKKITHVDKEPKNQKPHVGVEIEFFCWLDRVRLAKEFADAKLEDKVKVGHDGSIIVPRPLSAAGYIGHEVKIIDTQDKIFQTVEKVCEILKKWDAQVNKSCGLHVHLDMRNRSKEVCFNNLVQCQDFFYKLNPRYRKTSQYCSKNKTPDINGKKIEERLTLNCQNSHLHTDFCYSIVPTEVEVDNSKYKCVNKLSYNTYKTIEVRVHTGTVCPNKINNWIKLLVNIVNKKQKIQKPVKQLTEYKKAFNCDKSLEKYIRYRLHKLSKTPNIEERV